MSSTSTPPGGRGRGQGRPRRVTIIGGGMAGSRLAYQLAECGAPCEVTLIGEERHAPYNRVLLAEVLAGRYAPEVIKLPESGAPTVRQGLRAVRIDRSSREVVCGDGVRVPYDTLVLATGSNPVLPPLLRGPLDSLPPGVHAFRTLDDCLALAAAAQPGTRAVVVGGGLLGVSAARALAERGAQVVLAQQGERLMERHLDPQAAELLREHLTALGIETHVECRVRGLLADEATGAVRAVELADGFRLAADIVVLACGVRPRTGLAQEAGLAVGRGIVVDDRLRTSDPAVHAIGDCAEHDGVVYGLAGAARDQADVLARLLAGPDHAPEPLPRYSGTRALTRLTLAGSPASRAALDVAAFGDVVPAAGDDVLRLSDATRGTYRKVVLRDDRLVGGILLGDLASVGALARTWEDGEPLAPGASPLHLLTPEGGW